MYELTGTIENVDIDYRKKRFILTFSVNESGTALNCYDDLHLEEKLTFKIDKYHEKRSLNANSYAWKLITEIGNVLRTDKEDVYTDMLRRYGQSEMISVLAHIPLNGFIRYFDTAGESELNGKTFKHYKVYKGSSEFNRREMAIFIDGIVSEAKELGIQTETPDQLAKLKSLWGEA